MRALHYIVDPESQAKRSFGTTGWGLDPKLCLLHKLGMRSVLRPSCEVSIFVSQRIQKKFPCVFQKKSKNTFSSKKFPQEKKNLSNSACNFVRILNPCDFFISSPVAPLELGVTDFSSPFFRAPGIISLIFWHQKKQAHLPSKNPIPSQA